MQEMKLQDLKSKSPTELLSFAEEQLVENASTLRKQELMFGILKRLADNDVEIIGQGVVEVLQDGFGFLRSPDANYLPGPDDIYVSPSQIRRFSLRTDDGWFFAKLACVVALSIFHEMLASWVRDFAADRNVRPARFYRLVNEVPTVLMIAVVILVIVKPF